MQNNNSTTGFLAGALAGLAIGAMFGILMAPQKGSKTRSLISHKAQDIIDDASDSAKDLTNDLLDKSSHIYQNGVETIENIGHKVDRKSRGLSKRLRDKLHS